MSVSVVIPAYNAGRQIEGVLGRLAALEGCELERVIVVNDGSRDDTALKVRSAVFTRCELTLINRPENGGYGAAHRIWP